MTIKFSPSSQVSARVQESGKRQVRNGEPTNDLILSVYLDGNDRTFPRVLSLYVAPGSKVADVTFGKGVVAENRAGRLVRMAEGQAVTYKLTKKLADMKDIETLPTDLRTVLGLQ